MTGGPFRPADSADARVREDARHQELTLTGVQSRLACDGYVIPFNRRGREIVVDSTGQRVPFEQLRVDRVYRFEGISDPEDEAVLLAVAWIGPDGTERGRGTIELGYGPVSDVDDGAVLARLLPARA